MKTNEIIRGLVPAILGLCLASGWAASNEGRVKSKIKGKLDIIPLPYPQSGAAVGALRWGADPKEPATAWLPAEQTVTRAFIESVPSQVLAMENETKNSQWTLGVTAKPGPQLLETLKVASASGTAGISRDSVRFVRWGHLEERTVDLVSLSEAYLRGFFNMPGRALSANALSKLQLSDPSGRLRPWQVVRSVSATGMEYGLSKELGLALSAQVSTPTYGEAMGSFGAKLKNQTTLVVDQPMVIGCDMVKLTEVRPELPYIGENMVLSGEQLDSRYTFTWTSAVSGKKTQVTVDPTSLRETDRRMTLEASLPAPVVSNLTQQIKSCEPVRMALVAEAKPVRFRSAEENHWRRLDEGAMFHSGEIVRLRVVLEEPAYVYVLAKDSRGQAAVLFPSVPEESLSRGEEKPVAKGEWRFPENVVQEEGMTYSANDPAGIESFIVVASRNKAEGLPASLGAFAKAAREQANKPAAPTRGVELGMLDVLRLPAGFSSASAETPAAPVAAGAQPQPAPPANGLQLFSGLKSATVLTLNLNRIAPPKP